MAQVYRCDRSKTIYDDNQLIDVLVPAVGAFAPRDAVGAAKLVAEIEETRVGICHPCAADVHAFIATFPK